MRPHRAHPDIPFYAVNLPGRSVWRTGTPVAFLHPFTVSAVYMILLDYRYAGLQ